MRDAEGLVLNYYGPSTITAGVRKGMVVTLSQETSYPISGRIVLRVDPAARGRFTLKLRIPYWSADTGVSVNGEAASGVVPGQYLVLDRTWQEGDTVVLDLDLSLHYWSGERECAGQTAVYRGPILLAYDHRYNLDLAAGEAPSVRTYETWKTDGNTVLDVPTLDARTMQGRAATWDDWLPPWMLFAFQAADGRVVHLCDFGSAGEAGTLYRSWLPIANAPGPFAFSKRNPLRSGRT
jgi:DUF1680 family protein